MPSEGLKPSEKEGTTETRGVTTPVFEDEEEIRRSKAKRGMIGVFPIRVFVGLVSSVGVRGVRLKDLSWQPFSVPVTALGNRTT